MSTRLRRWFLRWAQLHDPNVRIVQPEYDSIREEVLDKKLEQGEEVLYEITGRGRYPARNALIDDYEERLKERKNMRASVSNGFIASLVPNGIQISGLLMDDSVNQNNWAIERSSYDSIAQQLSGTPLVTDHDARVSNVCGKILSGVAKETGIYYSAEIFDDDIIERIKRGIVKGVSIRLDGRTVCSVCGNSTRTSGEERRLIHLCDGAHEIVKDPRVYEVSLVLNPAYPGTEFKVED